MRFKYKSAGHYKLEIAKKGDVGMDLKCLESFKIKPFETKKIKTGIQLELPSGYEAQVRPKSSLSCTGILIHLGTVDNEYRGDITVVMTNLTSEVIEFEKLQKIAQLVVKKYEDDIETIEAEEISEDTERGITGFGSSGKF